MSKKIPGSVYVSNTAANSIVHFGNVARATGNVVPNDTISGSATQLVSPQYLFVDAKDDRLFVANSGAGSVLIFEHASSKTGNVAPERTISGAATTLVSPADIVLDATRDLLYVADGANVLVFANASTVKGDIAPARTISIGFTITALLVDSGSDRLFLANGAGNAVDVFDAASTLNNTVSANRIISGPQTQLSTPSGLQLDGNGRLVVGNFGNAAITIYSSAATADGNMTPAATILGTKTHLAAPSQIAVESGSNNQLFVADGTAASIFGFGNFNSASGDLAPTNLLNGSNTGLDRSGGGAGPVTAKGIALDPTR
jgi:hypothetical protein